MNKRRLLVLPFLGAALITAAASGQQAGDSPHGALSTDLDCATCHTPDGWSPAKSPMNFDHDRGTEFALMGRHGSVSCSSCHLGLRFDEPRVAVDDCSTCHLDVHRGNLAAPCTSCHNTVAFTDVSGVAVHTGTSFPLIGAHLQVTCETCHLDDRGGSYTSLDVECVSCHQAEYDQTQTIDHADATFPMACDQCHNGLAWEGGALFDHVQDANGYALLGAHVDMRCGNCHLAPGNDLIHTPASENDCIACHNDDHQREHVGYPVTCLDCHQELYWEGAVFDHQSVGNSFPLVGAHVSLPCTECHLASSDELIFQQPANEADCAACHQAAYDTEHVGTGFPMTCLTCHNVDTWGNASFADHAQYFPIYSGAHGQDKWGDCSKCHTNPNDFMVFTCISCHEHSKSAMDSDHSGEDGYVYDSMRCYSCHEDGRS